MTLREKCIKLSKLDNIRSDCFCPQCDKNNMVVLGGKKSRVYFIISTLGRVYMLVFGTCEQREKGNKEIKTLELL